LLNFLPLHRLDRDPKVVSGVYVGKDGESSSSGSVGLLKELFVRRCLVQSLEGIELGLVVEPVQTRHVS